MKKIWVIKELEKHPLFTLNDFVRLAKKPPEYARTYLYRLQKEKLVFRVEKGKYTVFDNPLVFSSYITIPSYISFWTAIRYYNLTEQLPSDIMIATAKPKKSIDFRGIKIRFFKTKHMWGYGKQRYNGFDIFVADREKCVVDSMLIKNTPFDEVIKSIRQKGTDKKKLAEYAIKTGNKALMKRIGFTLRKIPDFNAEWLIKHLDNNYIPLDWDHNKKGKKDKEWKIIINRRLDDIT
ncbi:hypothetical protein FJZ53_00605 [Candidatus Woesearchaeota archaeon]|nr:hypothetical protein [Candidatus Woesearchaeota archaeon]